MLVCLDGMVGVKHNNNSSAEARVLTILGLCLRVLPNFAWSTISQAAQRSSRTRTEILPESRQIQNLNEDSFGTALINPDIKPHPHEVMT